MEDREAIARLQRGDIGGLEVLVRRYQVQAVRVAYLVTRDRPLAEDIVQAAFLRVYERSGQFDAGRPFGPWFLRGVVNDAAKADARAERQVSLEEESEGEDLTLADLLADPSPGPEELLERAEVHRMVWEALDKLSPGQRAAVVLRYYLGLKQTEVAGRLNCSPGTAKRHLHAARGRLRGLLGGLFPGLTAGTPAPRAGAANPRPDTAPKPTD